MQGHPEEPLLTPEHGRLVLFPIRNDAVWKMYQKAKASFWTPEEIDLSRDKADFDGRLTSGERDFVEKVLAFFSASDAIVNENLAQNFMAEVQNMEARCFYGFQIMMENIHSETYALLIDTLVSDKQRKHHLFNAVVTIPTIERKAEWCFRWMNRQRASFAERLVAFAVVEGVFFSAAFCSIFWLKKRGLMPGLCFSNELISRDEGLHCKFACLLYSQLRSRASEERVHAIVREAVELECAFVSDALPVRLLGMNADAMCSYVRFCADRLLRDLEHSPAFHATNPFEWMELISLTGKTNFFERRVAEYAKAGVDVAGEVGAEKFVLDAEF